MAIARYVIYMYTRKLICQMKSVSSIRRSFIINGLTDNDPITCAEKRQMVVSSLKEQCQNGFKKIVFHLNLTKSLFLSVPHNLRPR